ncbi:hypothetical protein [Algisphaera agarilytica]|uniref:Quinol:cytochrome C oxidoreductase n=1 Tax=Algisphaera agarilytica TaxID=1385975 RepID=A0A7X0LK46_9BACT|nr:hypothetical protein [Algisphaera agarilytica]MBB6429449.1 hypothetical protein [Algisphaera agarilytica]
MSAHPPKQLSEQDKAVLGDKAWPLRRNLLLLGGIALLVAVIGAALPKTVLTGGWERLGFAYLIGYAFALAITLGSLFFVLVTTVFRAGWCVAFRRVPENIAANMPTMGLLAIPILITVLINNGALYPWAKSGVHEAGKKIAYPAAYAEDGKHADEAHSLDNNIFLRRAAAGAPAEEDGHAGDDHGKHDGEKAHDDHGHDAHHGDHKTFAHTAATHPDHDHALPYFVYKKGAWYTPPFWVVRWVFYIAVWSFLGWFYWKRSVMQDADGDVQHTHKREWWAPLSLVAFAVTLTLGAFDLLMSLDPVWYSTMFGVYFFAGCFTAALCTMIITLMLGQKAGYFSAVTTDHFHDLGKLLFAFVFFWGYVGFSQFMLIWYASLPETTYWWEIRGVTSVSGTSLEPGPETFGSTWTVVAWTLLFAHLLFPFAILLSKHVKRNRVALFSMACWMLTLCYIDIFWVAMPALVSPDFVFGLPEIGCVVFCVSIMLAEALRRASGVSLTAHRDPRMHESLQLDTTAWAPIYSPPGKH